MSKLVSATFQGRVVLALTAALALCMPAWAQRQPIRRALMTTVKADRTADFEAAVKQYNEVLSKKIEGARSRSMFQALTGAHQYMLVRDYDKWADLDAGPVSKAIAANPELSMINLRMNSCVESETMVIQDLLPELSMPRPDGPPQIIRWARSRVRPDKISEFEAILKGEMLPAYQKAGSKSFTVRKVRFGAPTNEYYISTRLNEWADVDANLLSKSMGQEGYGRMVAKLSAITLQREVNLYRFRPDLSYDAKAVAVTTSSTAVH